MAPSLEDSRRNPQIIDLLLAQTAVALTLTLHLSEPPPLPKSAILECLLAVWILMVLLPTECLLYMYLFVRAREVLGCEPISTQ